jgi:peptide deformylase
MKRELVDSKDPVLYTRCEEFNFANPQIPTDEFETVFREAFGDKNWALGIAANQLGLPYRVIGILNHSTREIGLLFNPKIVDYDDEMEYIEEGCLSFPGVFIKIKRPKSIRLRWENKFGEKEASRFTGLTARVIQHECDHIDGIDFVKRATLYHRRKAFKARATINKARERIVGQKG